MERSGLGDLQPLPSNAAADAAWVVDGVSGWLTVGSLLPVSFPAYARLFHPARLGATEVQWVTVAAANGRRAHAGMQWVALVGSWDRYCNGTQPGWWDQPPTVGSLPIVQARRLSAVLEQFTTTADDCVYAVWNGFGDLAVSIEDAAGDAHLEVWRASPDDRIDGGSDALNPTPPLAGRSTS
jgi:hypothetical protein